jgi:predicted porin
MQKKVIALAVAAGLMSGAAFAQSNVTFYGVIDSDFTYSKAGYKKFSGIEDGGNAGSRIGVRGEEGLGNGLKAIFEMEWAAKGSDAGALGGERHAWVGLSGNFGTVRAGLIPNVSDDWGGATSSNGIAETYPVNNLRGKFGVVAGGAWNNAVSYYTPNFSGLDFGAVYSFGEQVSTRNPDGTVNKKDGADAGMLSLGARYANGPLTLIAVYEAAADNAYNKTSNPGAFGTKGWMIGGAYDLKVVKVYANYFRAKANHGGLAKTTAAADVGSDKQTLWSVGVSAPVSSAGTVMFEYGQYKDYYGGLVGSNEYGTRYVTYDSALGAPGSNVKAYGFGYRHSLSKRTMLYTSVSRYDRDKGLNGGVGNHGMNGSDTAGETQSNFQFGLVHNF